MKSMLRPSLVSLLPILAFLIVARYAGADSFPPLRAGRIFASPEGYYGAKVTTCAWTRPEESTLLTLFTYDDGANEVVRWTKKMDHVPRQVLVSDAGRVVLVDEYAHLGFSHAIVILSEGGGVLRDYALDELLSPREIERYTIRTVEARMWAHRVQMTFGPSPNEFVLKCDWGRSLTFDLTGGAIRK